ncbi:MAG TPA: type II toxin-antitoxin system VapC family toxin [Candidatus Binatia bacterium]|nr:type II toxin-antitoxin system VapC family toxin [Candidatus Binatia bacterium]
MRILLDTATFLWVVTDAPDLSDDAREWFVDPDNEVYLSSVSTWEIAIKHSLGKLPLPDPPARFIPTQRKDHGIDSLSLDEEATLHLARLPALHKDPFDRMLVCQAVVQNLVILTSDELISQYPVRTIW